MVFDLIKSRELIQNSQKRRWLIGISALDWPVKKIHQSLEWLKTGELKETDFQTLNLRVIQKLALTEYQIKTAKKFFSEYNFCSFQNWLIDQQIRVCCELDTDYPNLLKQLDLAPPVLWFKGNWPISPKLVAVVGTRHPSQAGVIKTQQAVAEIVSLGYGIVSGFMFGSDQVAQQQALKSAGDSIGILGFGFKYIYPASFFSLAQRFLADGGTLISPFSPWAKPQKWRFLDRNKIVAGLAKAIIVTEALPRSGTHTTVTAGADLARLVGVLPSLKTSLFYAGEKALLDQGVTLVLEMADFLKVSQPKIIDFD